VEPPNLDFGIIVQGEQREATVVVNNGSSVPVRILEVTGSCGCVVGSPEARVLAPGQTTTLRVIYDSHGRIGQLRYSVKIRLTDVAAGSILPDAVFTIAVEVQQRFWSEPAGLDLGTVELGTEVVRELTLRSKEDQTWEPILSSPLPAEASLEHGSPQEGLSYPFRLRLRAEGHAGVRDYKLLMCANQSEKTPIEIPVRYSVPSHFRVSPETVQFGLISPNEPKERIVRIVPLKRTPSSTLTFVEGIEWLKASLRQAEDGYDLILSPAVQGLRRGQVLTGIVRIRTMDPLERLLLIPVDGLLP
jgi:hypothetical protein